MVNASQFSFASPLWAKQDFLIFARVPCIFVDSA